MNELANNIETKKDFYTKKYVIRIYMNGFKDSKEKDTLFSIRAKSNENGKVANVTNLGFALYLLEVDYDSETAREESWKLKFNVANKYFESMCSFLSNKEVMVEFEKELDSDQDLNEWEAGAF